MKIKSYFFFTLISFSSLALAGIPTSSQIYETISNKEIAESEEMEIFNTLPIRLKNGETAYFSSINYEDSRRNGWGGYVLTRPKLGESQILQLADAGGQYNEFKIFRSTEGNREGGSIILLGGSSSGQGASSTDLFLVMFDGWNPSIKYKTKFESDSDSCLSGLGRECIWSEKFINESAGVFVETEIYATTPDIFKIPYKYSYKVKRIILR